MNKLLINSLCCIGIVSAMTSCGSSSKKKEAAEAARQDSLKQAEMAQKQKEADELITNLEDEPIFDIVTNLGTIKVKLYRNTPKHRANFEKLALSGFYDSLLFHRVIDGFMIQGGDPYTKDTLKVAQYGQGGPGYTIPSEFRAEYTHKKGALAAARRGDRANPAKESSGSQFYIVQDEAACAQLNGEYTVFGETVEGLNVIDKIASVATDNRDRPRSDVRIITIKLDPASQPAAKTEPADSTEKK